MILIKACGVWCKNGRTGAPGAKDLVLSLHLFMEGMEQEHCCSSSFFF